MKRSFLFLLLALFVANCGVKRDPLPPLEDKIEDSEQGSDSDDDDDDDDDEEGEDQEE